MQKEYLEIKDKKVGLNINKINEKADILKPL